MERGRDERSLAPKTKGWRYEGLLTFQGQLGQGIPEIRFFCIFSVNLTFLEFEWLSILYKEQFLI